MSLRSALAKLLPAGFRGFIHRKRRELSGGGFIRGFSSWQEAREQTRGYEDGEITSRVVEASRAVEAGQAVYERDSVCFERVEYSWPLLAALLRVAAERGGLRVIDFGGALGSTWRQNRKFLEGLPGGVDWRVVEQPAMVQAGQREFQNHVLSFHRSISEAAAGGVDAILFCCSLCYVKNPWAVLQDATGTGARYLIFDRHPVQEGGEDSLVVQRVPPTIYRASYPKHLFAREKFIRRVRSLGFELVENWRDELQFPGEDFRYEGFFFRKQKDA